MNKKEEIKKKIISTKTVIDQMGRKIKFNFPPKRIVSLVPSQSELLWDLGLQKELVGITKFCIHPQEMFKSVERVGGTKKINFKKIEKLQPDLIIGNKEENERSDIEALSKKYPVWMSDIYTVSDAMFMIGVVGKITNREKEAGELLQKLEQAFVKHPLVPYKKCKQLRVAYFIWRNPYMVAGGNTYLNDVFKRMGLTNVFASKKWKKKDFENDNLRYPQISAAQLQIEKPDIIFLSSEPFPFKQKHIEEFKVLCPDAKIQIVDGEYFSWYGSRLLEGIPYLSQLSAAIRQ